MAVVTYIDDYAGFKAAVAAFEPKTANRHVAWMVQNGSRIKIVVLASIGLLISFEGAKPVTLATDFPDAVQVSNVGW